MTGEDLRLDVLAWVQENPFPDRHPLKWRAVVATRLGTYEDMRLAWRELAKHETMGRRVMSYVFSAFEAAQKECQRATASDEDERVQSVLDALVALREALARAPSPLFDSAHLEVAIDKHPIAFSWRTKGAKAAEHLNQILPSVCLDELLEFAESYIPVMVERQPTRTLSRQREAPELAAFVRHLAAWFRHKYGYNMKGTLARVATATFGRETVSQEQVERILRPPIKRH